VVACVGPGGLVRAWEHSSPQFLWLERTTATGHTETSCQYAVLQLLDHSLPSRAVGVTAAAAAVAALMSLLPLAPLMLRPAVGQ